MKKPFAFVLTLWLCSSVVFAAGTNRPDAYQRGVEAYYRKDAKTAIADFTAAVQQSPELPMPHLMMSRAYHQLKDTEHAYQQSELANKYKDAAPNDEWYMINSWTWRMRGEHTPTMTEGQEKALWNADYGIALYPNSADLYILRGELAVSPIRSAPYYLAALKLDPNHPLKLGWKPPILPLPKINVGPGKTVPAMTKPPKLFTGLGEVHHPITTRNPLVQKYFEQGLCEMYAYVTPEASRSFHHAAELDPHCAMAYWGLSFCVDNGDPINAMDAAQHALTLARKYGDQKEKWYCTARVLQLRRDTFDKFIDTIHAALMRYPDDVDLWVWRATMLGFAGEGPSQEQVSGGMPFILIAWHIQPDHPAANHEMIHAYEALDRPMLGWKYARGFAKSAPNMPHAQHMQAHLAMRLGRWKEALEGTRRSVHLSDAGFPELDKEHHRNVFMWALGHEGCFKEANALKLAKAADLAEARMLRLALDDDGLMKWAKQRQKDVFIDGYYIEGIEDVYRGKLDEARKMLPKLRRESPTWYGDPPPIFQQEVQARIDLASGKTDDAVGSLHHLAIKRDNTPQGHGWGQAAYYDEVWGEAALYAGELDGPSGADEAFHEAVAHEHGSIVGIVGLQVVAELRHDKVSVRNYAKRAAYTWERADPGALKRLTERMRKISQHQAPPI